jgi:hypothetical protein
VPAPLRVDQPRMVCRQGRLVGGEESPGRGILGVVGLRRQERVVLHHVALCHCSSSRWRSRARPSRRSTAWPPCRGRLQTAWPRSACRSRGPCPSAKGPFYRRRSESRMLQGAPSSYRSTQRPRPLRVRQQVDRLLERSCLGAFRGTGQREIPVKAPDIIGLLRRKSCRLSCG